MSENNFFIAFRWGFMFRIFGRGLHVSASSPVLFSERKGLKKKLIRVGSCAVEILKKGDFK